MKTVKSRHDCGMFHKTFFFDTREKSHCTSCEKSMNMRGSYAEPKQQVKPMRENIKKHDNEKTAPMLFLEIRFYIKME